MCHPLYGFFLLPGQWAPPGLHRALFMNSVSHGKIWTVNAASPLNKPCFAKEGMFEWYLSKNPPFPPPPPPFHLSLSNCQLRAITYCLRGGQFGGEGVGGGGHQNRAGKVYFVTWHPPPSTNQAIWLQIQVGP